MNDLSFEEAYNELEGVVSQLEAGGSSLDEMLELYERGAALSQRCAALLDQAELRVSQLRDRDDGGMDEEPLPWGRQAS